MAVPKLLSVIFLLFFLQQKANAQGLSVGFYNETCPSVEAIIYETTAKFVSRAPSLAPAMLRMHFHDCFVRVKGPRWRVRLGRRDGNVSMASEALPNLPPPSFNVTQLIASFAAKGLSVKDLAVLSGGHTIGVSHCFSFSNRLDNFTGRKDADPSMDPKYVSALKKRCRPSDTTTIVLMDPGSSQTFDVDYYTLVRKRRGVLQTDAALLNDNAASAYVELHATASGESSFFQDFAESMVRMGQIGVLTGTAGQIRNICSAVN
ncbi:UNVERIFIED_CONTAM: Peroxidase 27 [Sesamum latifolium]|uniref:peroxidase n=1 Tax=Sesamum latifolium TaxID=2727402 RepID=A0AAW2TLE2_9LAMI